MPIAAIYYNTGLDITKTNSQAFINDASTTEFRFHNLIMEEHQAASEVTQYPIQAGFLISNHSIRKNRNITLTGDVSNINMAEKAGDDGTTRKVFDVGKNHVKKMYSQLETLVRDKIPCTVLSNIGTYTPVIFTQISTKQQAGMMDSAQIRLVGTEVVVSGETSVSQASASDTQVLPQQVSEADRTAITAELESQGIIVNPNTTMSEVKVPIGESVTLVGCDPKGNKVPVSFNNTTSSTDPDAVTESVRYSIESGTPTLEDTLTSVAAAGGKQFFTSSVSSKPITPYITPFVPSTGELIEETEKYVGSCVYDSLEEVDEALSYATAVFNDPFGSAEDLIRGELEDNPVYHTTTEPYAIWVDAESALTGVGTVALYAADYDPSADNSLPEFSIITLFPDCTTL